MTNKRGLCHLIALAMTAATFLWVLCFSDMTIMNDDAVIMRSFMGYETGVPATFNLFVHGLFAVPLGWLSTVFPNLPWFSYLQVGLMMLSCQVIVKSILQCFLKHQKPLWLGAVFAAAFLIALCLSYFVSFTFTMTTGLLSAAAVLQLLSIDHSRKRSVVIGVAGALCLLLFTYALRWQSALAALCFCALAFAYIIASEYWKKRPLKPMLIALAVIVLGMGAMAGLRALEVEKSGWDDYLLWQESRFKILDFYGMENVPQEILDEIGWTDVDAAMVSKWCFLSSDLTTEDLQAIVAYMEAQDTRTLADRVAGSWAFFDTLIINYPQDLIRLALGLFLGLAAAIAAFAKKKPIAGLTALCAMLGAAALLFLLTLYGRLQLRVLVVVMLPMAGVVFALVPEVFDKARWPVLFSAVYALACLYAAYPTLVPNEEAQLALGSAMTDLEEYALFESESLFIYDDTLTNSDQRPFPDYSEGMPHNITFWGGWGMRSPESEAQLARFGLETFTAQDLLRDDVYVVSGRVDPPPTLLLRWLEEEVGEGVEWEIYSEYGNVYIFKFVQY